MDWSPKLVHAEPDYALGSLGPVYVVIWRNETTLAGARHLASGFAEFRTPGKAHGLVTIIEQGAPLPPAEPRDIIASFLKAASEHLVVSAVVFEGEGFRGAAVRGVVTGLTMLARQSYPHRVFATIDEASSWYADNSPPDWRLAGSILVNGVNRLRGLVDET